MDPVGQRPGRPRRRSLAFARTNAPRRGLTVLAATLLATIGWWIAGTVLGIELVAAMGSSVRRVGPITVIVASTVAGLAAWMLLAVCERTVARLRTVWTMVAAAVLLGSLVGPLGASTTAATMALVCLHLLVGAALILGLGSSAGENVETPEVRNN